MGKVWRYLFKKRGRIEQVSKLPVQHAMLAESAEGLFVLTPKENYLYDIVDKRSPRLISTFNLNHDDYANSLLGVRNKCAFFSIGYLGVEVIDFQNETKPISSGLIKVVIGPRCVFYGNGYLITNPKTPQIYRIESPIAFNSVFEFDEWFVDFVIVENYLCAMVENDGIKVYDISEPSRPQLVSSLNLKIIRFVTVNARAVVAEGANSVIYILDLSNLPAIEILTKIKIPGPIAAGSISCKDNLLFVRFMRWVVADTAYVYNITDLKKPKRLLAYKSKGVPFYTANEKLLVLMGIKGWDGRSSIGNLTENLYKIFAIDQKSITRVDDIQLSGIWFSNILALDRFVYLARPDGIHIYEVTA